MEQGRAGSTQWASQSSAAVCRWRRVVWLRRAKLQPRRCAAGDVQLGARVGSSAVTGAAGVPTRAPSQRGPSEKPPRTAGGRGPRNGRARHADGRGAREEEADEADGGEGAVGQGGGRRGHVPRGAVRPAALVAHRVEPPRADRQAVPRALAQPARPQHQEGGLERGGGPDPDPRAPRCASARPPRTCPRCPCPR